MLSTNKTVTQLHRILHKFHSQDKFEALIPWDFGVGISEQEAEQKLQIKSEETATNGDSTNRYGSL